MLLLKMRINKCPVWVNMLIKWGVVQLIACKPYISCKLQLGELVINIFKRNYYLEVCDIHNHKHNVSDNL